jgi:hypothetical protein
VVGPNHLDSIGWRVTEASVEGGDLVTRRNASSTTLRPTNFVPPSASSFMSLILSPLDALDQ